MKNADKYRAKERKRERAGNNGNKRAAQNLRPTDCILKRNPDNVLGTIIVSLSFDVVQELENWVLIESGKTETKK